MRPVPPSNYADSPNISVVYRRLGRFTLGLRKKPGRTEVRPTRADLCFEFVNVKGPVSAEGWKLYRLKIARNGSALVMTGVGNSQDAKIRQIPYAREIAR
jgi:hypothetical protein